MFFSKAFLPFLIIGFFDKIVSNRPYNKGFRNFSWLIIFILSLSIHIAFSQSEPSSLPPPLPPEDEPSTGQFFQNEIKNDEISKMPVEFQPSEDKDSLRFGIRTLSLQPFNTSLYSDSLGGLLFYKGTVKKIDSIDEICDSIRYIALPLALTDGFRLRIPVSFDSPLPKRAMYKNEPQSRFTKQGGISRGVRFGTGRDVTLSSDMNLEVTGQLGEELFIMSVLTDRSTPIQPEGTTTALSELDKVFIEAKGKGYLMRFGDIDIDLGRKTLISMKWQV